MPFQNWTVHLQDTSHVREKIRQDAQSWKDGLFRNDIDLMVIEQK